jgi:phosphoglycerate kinase
MWPGWGTARSCFWKTAGFTPGEEANEPDFAAALARVGDVYVNDAFSAAHRAHASTEGIARLLPAYAGRAMQEELEALDKALSNPKHPVLAVVGGAKVSTKIELLANLLSKVDALVIGGGMANTFLAAKGVEVGKSLNEPDLAATARQIMTQAADRGTAIILPSDVVVAKAFEANSPHQTVTLDRVPPDMMILDAGPATTQIVNAWISEAKTLVWNGPLGAFEKEPFDRATVAAARHAAQRTRDGKLLSVAGGGDTVAALNHAGAADGFSYISTAGGAFLEWLEGKPLPGVEALRTGAPGRRLKTHGRASMSERIEDIAIQMVAEGKGILAADESTGTIKKRFDSLAWRHRGQSPRLREMLFSA